MLVCQSHLSVSILLTSDLLLQTDVSHTKQMIIYVYFVDVAKDYEFATEYFGMIECNDGTAPGITNTLVRHIQSFQSDTGEQWLWQKWVTFGTDGPSVMTGTNGVHERIKEFKDYLVGVHCVGHRTALAANDTFTHSTVPFCSNLDEFLRALGRFYSWSTERRVELRELAHDNDEPETQVTLACQTRWLSRDRAAVSVLNKYTSITEQHYNGQDNNSTSMGLYRKLTDYKYFAGLAAVADVLAAQAALSRTFQSHQLDGFTVKQGIEDFKIGMAKYNTTSTNGAPYFGPNLTDLVRNIGDNYFGESVQDFLLSDHGFEVSFSVAKRDFIEGFVKNLANAALERIDERFPNVALLEAFDIFDVRRLPTPVPDCYGDGDIKLLHAHFKHLVQVPVDVAISEWRSFLTELQRRPSSETFQITYAFFKGKHGLGSRMMSVSAVPCSCTTTVTLPCYCTIPSFSCLTCSSFIASCPGTIVHGYQSHPRVRIRCLRVRL